MRRSGEGGKGSWLCRIRRGSAPPGTTPVCVNCTVYSVLCITVACVPPWELPRRDSDQRESPAPGEIFVTLRASSHMTHSYCGNTGQIRGFVYYRCMLQVHLLLLTLPRNFSPLIRVQVIRLSLTHQFVTKYPSHIQFDPERDLNIHESIR